MPDQLPEASEELAEFVKGVVKRHSAYVNSEADLQSLLYDIDLLPEQLLHLLRVNPPAAGPNATRMSAVCALWKARDPAKWAALQTDPAGWIIDPYATSS